MTNIDIIERAGGDEKVAKVCDVSLDAIRKWREAGRVPPKHWPTVAQLSGTSLDVVAAARLGVRREVVAAPKRKRAA